MSLRPAPLAFVIAVVALAAAGCKPPTPRPLQPEPKPAPPPLEPTAPEKPAEGPKQDYPPTRRADVSDTVHGVTIVDPYRWLEKGDDPEVQAWLGAQDGYARARLGALPGREALGKRLRELLYVDVVGVPYRYGKRYFWSHRHADKEKAIIYWKEGDQGAAKVLFDPNTMSADGSVALRGWVPSEDGRVVAYKLAKNNADTATLYVRDVATGKDLGDVIEGAKYATPSWTHDHKGFYYTWLPTEPGIPVADLPGKAEVRYHRLGTDPAKDEVIVPATNDPTAFQGVAVTEDGRWLVHYLSHGWSDDEVWLRDLKDPKAKGKPLTPFAVGHKANFDVQAWKGFLYVRTNHGAPRGRVFKVDPRKLAREDWKEIVPEGEGKLDAAGIVGGKLMLAYQDKAVSRLEIRDLDGKKLRDVALPGLGTSSGFVGRADDDRAYYAYTSFTQPAQIYETSVKTGASKLWFELKVPVDTSKLEVEQVFYTSRDGTRVSMFLVHQKGLVIDGENPTLLYGYGGFNSGITPYFSGSFVAWIERGGVLAIPNLRGGDEYGEEWHQAGMFERKQNVFDDFIAAAEWLVKEKVTRPARLAIYGGSNGGLLVGAAMVQRPDLFGAVVCAVPLLDMVRYHMFGSGQTWTTEYGSAEHADQFKYLHAYSPYHQVKAGTAYPPVLMLTADSDDRVDPMHARKFVALLQASSAGGPVWMRVEKNAGHGGGDMISKKVDESVDVYSWLWSVIGR